MPGKRDRPPRPKHDASYKSFFAIKRTVADTLRGALGDLAPGLDFSTLQRLPASFVTEHLGQRHADMLWRIQVAERGWLYLLVLLEFQSTIDRRMALRMTDYTVRVLQGLDREDLGPGGRLPFILPMVVYNGERRWNAATDIRDLFPSAPKRLVGYVPRHRYLLIEVRMLDASGLPPDNVLSMIARLEQARSTEQLKELLASLADWLGEPELLKSLKTWIESVIELRFPSMGHQLEVRDQTTGGMQVTTLLERVQKWGEQERQQWLKEGLERGRIDGERDLVRRLVSRRYGPEAADQLVPVLEELSDPDRIAAVADAVIECEAAEEFIARAREVAGAA